MCRLNSTQCFFVWYFNTGHIQPRGISEKKNTDQYEYLLGNYMELSRQICPIKPLHRASHLKQASEPLQQYWFPSQIQKQYRSRGNNIERKVLPKKKDPTTHLLLRSSGTSRPNCSASLLLWPKTTNWIHGKCRCCASHVLI